MASLRRHLLSCLTMLLLIGLSVERSPGRPLTLPEAIEIALHRSTRADLIDGEVEISEQVYEARRLNFYLPSVSMNGNLPSYDVDESYRFFGGSSRKRLYKTSDLGFLSFIQLQQNLLTGGSLKMSANLAATSERYPNTSSEAAPGSFLDEETRRGFFDVSLEQPLLQPSAPKNEIDNRRDDLRLARLGRIEETAALEASVADAYLGLLDARLELRVLEDKLEAARLKASIDSVKWQDGLVTEEASLASAAAHLDADLAFRDGHLSAADRNRALALLLDLEPDEPLEPSEPDVVDHPDDAQLRQCVHEWEQSVPVRKAEVKLAMSRRAASFAAGGHGLTGQLRARYSTGQGTIRFEDRDDESIDTRGWAVSLNFSYPIWDGGTSAAEINGAKARADNAYLEFLAAKRAAQADIARLANEVAVGRRRLEILAKKLDLARNSEKIARERLADGRLSRLGFLEVRIAREEAERARLAELRAYLKNRIALEGSYSPAAG